MNINLNIAQIVQAGISSLLIFVVSTTVAKIDKFNDTVTNLSVHIARMAERNSFQEKRDADQDHRLDIQRQHIDALNSVLQQRPNLKRAVARP